MAAVTSVLSEVVKTSAGRPVPGLSVCPVLTLHAVTASDLVQVDVCMEVYQTHKEPSVCELGAAVGQEVEQA